MSVDVRSDKLGELVDENVEVEQLGTGFTFTEGPIWNPEGQFLLFSDMPGDTRRRWDEQNGVEVVAQPEQQGQRHDAGRGRPADRLRALDELARPHGPRRQEHEPRGARLPLRGPGAEQPERRVRQVRRLDLVLRPLVRAHARLRRRARARARLAGRLPDRARAAATRSSSSSKDEYEQPNGLCFSPDESLLYINDTPKAWIKVYDVGSDGTPLERPACSSRASAAA